MRQDIAVLLTGLSSLRFETSTLLRLPESLISIEVIDATSATK